MVLTVISLLILGIIVKTFFTKSAKTYSEICREYNINEDFTVNQKKEFYDLYLCHHSNGLLDLFDGYKEIENILNCTKDNDYEKRTYANQSEDMVD